jgi:hypothetical protein
MEVEDDKNDWARILENALWNHKNDW